MLAIRLQRTGRSNHAQFRLIVQDSRFSPKSGRVVAYLGSYDPHTKAATFDLDKAKGYLKNGAQPSDRVATLLKKEGLKLPTWVTLKPAQKIAIRHPDKLRRNRPAGAPEPAKPEPAAPKDDKEETKPADQPEETTAEATEEKPAEEPSTGPTEEQPQTEAVEPSEEPAVEAASEPVKEDQA